MSKRIDITGGKYGRLKALKRLRTTKSGRSVWLVRCVCGREIEVGLGNLRNGTTRSCGCLKSDVTIERNKTHGMSHTIFYSKWLGMKNRCENGDYEGFERYGGRGIRICPRWEDFESFSEDMLKSYKAHVDKYGKKDTQLDRINNDGDYSPKNCRWSTRKEQALNRSSNRIIEFKGKKKHLSKWAKEIGIETTTLWQRLNRGWSRERALTAPVRAPMKTAGDGELDLDMDELLS